MTDITLPELEKFINNNKDVILDVIYKYEGIKYEVSFIEQVIDKGEFFVRVVLIGAVLHIYRDFNAYGSIIGLDDILTNILKRSYCIDNILNG